jgi:hypothetical protein
MMPKKGLALLIAKGKPEMEEEESEGPGYEDLAQELIDAVKAGDKAALAEVLAAIAGD